MKHNNTLLHFHDGSETTVAQAIEIRPARDYRALRQLKRRKRREALLRVGLVILGWLALACVAMALVVMVAFVYTILAA